MTLLRGYLARSGPSDTEAPTISTVVEVAQGYDPYLFVNRGLVLKATFSEDMDPLTGTGTRIAVNFGGTTKYCSFSSWSSTTEALYVYLLDGTEHDEDGLTVSSPIDLNGGTLKDEAGNDATLTFSPPSLSSFRVVLRGMAWGTDFTQGADAQKIYSVIGNTQITADVGQLGSTSGSDADDPTFQNYGMNFDAGLFVKDIGSNGQFDRLGDTSKVWSMHFRVRADVSYGSVYGQLFNCGNYTTGGGANFHTSKSGGNLYVTYENPGYSAAPWNTGLTTAEWATISFTCDGADAVKFYLNGAYVGAQSVSNRAAANLKAEIQKANGLGASWANGMPFRARCIAYCTVEHSADEVAANHAYLAALDGIINGDTTAPTVSTAYFSNQPGDTYYSSVGTLNLDVVFNEAVTVTGTPQFTIDADTALEGFPKALNYTSGSGTTTLRFAYAVDSNDDSGSSDLNAPSTSALALNGGTIKDQYGNNATLTLPSGLTNRIGGNDGEGIQIIPG